MPCPKVKKDADDTQIPRKRSRRDNSYLHEVKLEEICDNPISLSEVDEAPTADVSGATEEKARPPAAETMKKKKEEKGFRETQDTKKAHAKGYKDGVAKMIHLLEGLDDRVKDIAEKGMKLEEACLEYLGSNSSGW